MSFFFLLAASVAAGQAQDDFWGVVFPSYLGAVGGIASAGVAIAAFVQSVRNKRSTRALKEGAIPEESALATTFRADHVARANEASTDSLQSTRPLTSWRVERERSNDGRRFDLVLINESPRPLTLTGVEIFDGKEWRETSLAKERLVQPQEDVPFNFRLGPFAGDIVTLGVRWTEPGGELRRTRLVV